MEINYFERIKKLDKDCYNELLMILEKNNISELVFPQQFNMMFAYIDDGIIKTAYIGYIYIEQKELYLVTSNEEYIPYFKVKVGTYSELYVYVLSELTRRQSKTYEQKILIEDIKKNKTTKKFFYLPLKYCSYKNDEEYKEKAEKFGQVLTMEEYAKAFNITCECIFKPNSGELKIFEVEEYKVKTCPYCGNEFIYKDEICPICNKIID
jgi:hypothetical protein